MYRKIIVFTLTFCFLLAGCGNTECSETSADYKAADLAYTIVSNLSFQGELNRVDDEIAKIYFNTDEVETSLYLSNSGSEMVAAFRENISSTDNLNEIINVFLNDQRSAFDGYSPIDVKRIDNAVRKTSGNNTVVIIADDVFRAEEVVDGIFDGTLAVMSADIVPFLVDHYEYIYGIDYRYGREHLVEFARKYNVSDILFVVAMINTGNSYAVGRMQELCQ